MDFKVNRTFNSLPATIIKNIDGGPRILVALDQDERKHQEITEFWIKKEVRRGWDATSSLPVFRTSSQRGPFKYSEKVSSESHVNTIIIMSLKGLNDITMQIKRYDMTRVISWWWRDNPNTTKPPSSHIFSFVFCC